MRFQPRNDPETPPDHWKINVVQKTSRLSTRASDLNPSAGPGGAAKRRRLSVVLRTAVILGFFAVVGALGWLAWEDSSKPRVQNAETAVENTPGKSIEFINDGVITKQWVVDLLGTPLPPILDAQRKLEAVPQIKKVELRRISGGAYEVRISEREPVARIWIRTPDGKVTVSLVSTDGVVYEPVNIGAMTVQNLPLIENSKPRRAGNFIVIDGFASVANFIRTARTRHPALYREWLGVSLADFDGRPAAPGSVFRVKPRLTTRNGEGAEIVEIVFSPVDYEEELRQLARPEFQEGLRQSLLTADRAKYPAYRLDLSMVNASNPSFPVMQPRLQAVSAAPRQP